MDSISNWFTFSPTSDSIPSWFGPFVWIRWPFPPAGNLVEGGGSTGGSVSSMSTGSPIVSVWIVGGVDAVDLERWIPNVGFPFRRAARLRRGSDVLWPVLWSVQIVPHRRHAPPLCNNAHQKSGGLRRKIWKRKERNPISDFSLTSQVEGIRWTRRRRRGKEDKHFSIFLSFLLSNTGESQRK